MDTRSAWASSARIRRSSVRSRPMATTTGWPWNTERIAMTSAYTTCPSAHRKRSICGGTDSTLPALIARTRAVTTATSSGWVRVSTERPSRRSSGGNRSRARVPGFAYTMTPLRWITMASGIASMSARKLSSLSRRRSAAARCSCTSRATLM